MSNKTLNLTEQLYEYALASSNMETEVQRSLREVTSQMKESNMQISPEQGQFMQLLVQIMHARFVLEIGVFTGYSALSVAMGLPEGGKVIACDVSEEWTNIGKKYWRQAGVEDRIELHIAPAQQTLQKLIETGKTDHFDFAFIDADKENYDTYYEQCLQLIRPNGLILIDNTLWSGDVIDPEKKDPETEAIRQLNAKIAGDKRVDVCLMPISDGLSMIRVK